MAFEGAFLWDLKDWIDRKWMAQYTTMLPKAAEEMAEKMRAAALAAALPGTSGHPAGKAAIALLSHATMRCGGCGAKVGASTLSRVMQRLRELQAAPSRPEVLVGLDAPDDAAVVRRVPRGMASVQTVDFFRSFVDDPYIFGKIAAVHALSDCHAMGAQPVTALAIAVVPYGVESIVEENLFQMMAGACEALRESGCALVGGHTCEGAELSLGFAVNGMVRESKVLTKGGGVSSGARKERSTMRPGDLLVLTKPIGTGALFAANMRVRADGAWVQAALASMTTSNAKGAEVLRRFGCSAATDITGFGLLGHAVEMLKLGGVRAELHLPSVPLLAGALDCVRRGIMSSLQPENFRLRRAVANQARRLSVIDFFPRPFPQPWFGNIFPPFGLVFPLFKSSSIEICRFMFFQSFSHPLIMHHGRQFHLFSHSSRHPVNKRTKRPSTTHTLCSSTHKLPAASWQPCHPTKWSAVWPL
jgi:selenide,water dikinase